ncbi:MAG: SDR family NAD(P)-dependent oxidoreductase [Micropruina sp.]|uniref:SDR family NAD(P)-dependent oxidoreductase n=1 Tax=Micropruina sp. TaxID=2737536 RepID=UPI0039E3FA3F
MSVIAIIGAGPGLGAATARRFAREGFSLALISRTPEKLSSLREELAAEGIRTSGYAADVQDTAALCAALQAAASELGPIEVLQYSPVPRKEFLRPVLETSADDLAAAAAFSVIGPVTAVQTVLPGMEELGRGTILLVNGSSAARPNGNVAGTSIAFAGESAYGTMLHDALAPRNIHVAQLIIPGAIGGGDPLYAPEALADRLWAIHTDRGPFRTTVGEPSA